MGLSAADRQLQSQPFGPGRWHPAYRDVLLCSPCLVSVAPPPNFSFFFSNALRKPQIATRVLFEPLAQWGLPFQGESAEVIWTAPLPAPRPRCVSGVRWPRFDRRGHKQTIFAFSGAPAVERTTISRPLSLYSTRYTPDIPPTKERDSCVQNTITVTIRAADGQRPFRPTDFRPKRGF